MEIALAGTNALIVYFSHQISAEAAAQVAGLNQALRRQQPHWLVDTVPSYSSLLVVFDPYRTDVLAVKRLLKACGNSAESGGLLAVDSPTIRLPVYYSAESGPDLVDVARRAQLSVEDVIALHTGIAYRVYAIGFAPGFAYLGEVDPRIAAPRLSSPRTKVPKGAVAIADRQTAVYPAESPGGWNLIGLCPTPMFNPQAEPTMPVQSGDLVQFYAIDKDEYLSLGGEL